MGGGNGRGALPAQTLQNGNGQCRTFRRIGPRTQLVQKHQRIRSGFFHHLNDILHVRGKGGQTLLDALLIADIGENILKYRKLAGGQRRNVQPALCHHGKQSHRFQSDRFAAGIRPRHNQCGIAGAAACCHMDRHHFFLIDERMTCLLQIHISLLIDDGTFCPHHDRQLPLGEDHIQLRQKLLIVAQIVKMLCHISRKFCQNPLDFRLLCQFKLPQLIVQIHDDLRLDEEGGTGG